MATPNQAPMKVMVLSASPTTTQTIISILNSFDHKDITVLDNGIAGLKMLTEKAFNFVLVDMNIKFLPGWMFVKEIKTSDKIPNLPVVLMGESAPPTTDEEMRQFGIVKYMKAPYSNSDLSFLINSTLQLFKTSGTIENKYTKAKDALIGQKAKEAVEAYEELRGLTKNSARSSLGLAEAYIQNKQVEKAEEVILQINAKEESTPAAMVFRVRILTQRDKDEEARALANRLLTEVMPDAPFYYSRVLKIYTEFKKVDAAEAICETAFNKGFKVPEFGFTLARLKYQKSQFDVALKVTDEVEKQFGKSADLFNLRGVCYKKMSKFAEAIQSYEEALKVAPMEAKIYYNMAMCEIARKGYETALKQLEMCVKISPMFPNAKAKLDELTNFFKSGKKTLEISSD
jgi:tetratricopeptide (TPR) repeat protein